MKSQIATSATLSPERSEVDHLPSLLVIEDDLAQQMIAVHVGRKAGYTVVSAASVQDALEKLAQQPFDCVLLDLLLGGQNGMQLLGEVARLNRGALVIVTSSASEAVREETLRLATHIGLGVVQLPKPLDLAALRSLLAGRASVVQP